MQLEIYGRIRKKRTSRYCGIKWFEGLPKIMYHLKMASGHTLLLHKYSEQPKIPRTVQFSNGHFPDNFCVRFLNVNKMVDHSKIGWFLWVFEWPIYTIENIFYVYRLGLQNRTICQLDANRAFENLICPVFCHSLYMFGWDYFREPADIKNPCIHNADKQGV
jgi:hypothetical protein